ncbi:MAG: family channel protein [Nocardioides sp.]|nr:family channel protein [Nocardioides sp.]
MVHGGGHLFHLTEGCFMTEPHIGTDETPTTGQKFAAELLGTFVLVFFGVGAALMSNDYVTTGLSFGLAVMVMAYAVGRISGGHFNPAVTLGAVLGGRLPWKTAPVYVGAQLLGALLAGAALFGLMHGFESFSSEGNMGANSFGDEGSGYAMWAAFVLEMLLTAIFLYVILAVTDERNEFQALMGPLAIGFALAMIHFASMNATGTSVNPARSVGVGVFGGTDALIQLWLFIVAPLVGATIAGLTYPLVFGHASAHVPGSGLSFRSGRQQAVYAPPGTYEQQWNQGQPQWQGQPASQGQHSALPPQAAPQHWQPAPDPYAQPVPQQQPPAQQWGQPASPAGPPAAGPQHWGQPAPDPYAPPVPQQQPPAQNWGQPVEDDGEDGRTQVRRPD